MSQFSLRRASAVPRLGALVVAAVLIALLAPSAQADLPKSDRKAVKQMFEDRLYMRIDAPCATGRHPYGTYKRPLVEASPEGVNTEADEAMNASWFHADSTYWGIRINDPVELDEFDFDDDEIEVELEGVGPADKNATVIKFVDIDSLEDFQTAFDLVFATQPLQDEHDDWSDEVKEAIADRELQNGMTKRQVFYITGRPESFEKSEEDGKEVEIWRLRTDKGMKMGFFKAKAGESTGLPSSIRFEDGVLVKGSRQGSDDSFSLDD